MIKDRKIVTELLKITIFLLTRSHTLNIDNENNKQFKKPVTIHETYTPQNVMILMGKKVHVFGIDFRIYLLSVKQNHIRSI